MKTKFSEGSPIDVTVPSGGCTAGAGLLINGFFCVPVTTAAQGDVVSTHVTGVFDLTSDTGTAWSFGDVLYWDNTNKRLTKTSTSNTKVGQCVADKTSAATTGRIRLIPSI